MGDDSDFVDGVGEEEERAHKRARATSPTTSNASSRDTEPAEMVTCVPCADQDEDVGDRSILDGLAMEEAINSDADGARRFACDWPGCKKDYSQPNAVIRHKKAKHGLSAVWHACGFPGCEYKNTRKDKVDQHQQAHSDERPYACGHPGCDRAFKREGQRKEHKENMHSGKRPFPCDYLGCKRAFKQRGALTQHKAFKHSDERPFACDQPGCKEAFKQASDLKQHKADAHDIDVVPHECDADPDNCHYWCKRETTLRVHIRTQHSEVYAQRKKEQEERVRQALLAAGWQEHRLAEAMPPVGHFRREKRIDFECAKLQGASKYARIDFVLCVPNGFVFLEVDEDQHKYGYGAELSCDMKRMANVMESLAVETDYNAPPIYWLRYNPHAWQVGGETRRTEKVDREANLVAWLKDFECLAPFGIGYAFYDCEDHDERGMPGALRVLGNPEYEDEYAEVVDNLMDLA